jgi:hypothetical protein
MRAFGLHSGAGERGMVVTLYDDQCITNRIFVRDVPSVFGMTRAPTDLESATLAERVVRESAMRAEALAVQRFDRAGRLRNVLCEKVAKRSLADEADAGAVGFVVDRQSGGAGGCAHFCFGQIGKRKQRRA